MNALRLTPIQNREIHAIINATGLPDSSYRAMLAEYGVATSKDLSEDQAARLLSRMREIPGARHRGRRPAETAEGRFARQLQAMWIALYNLGAVESGDDAALHAFVLKQTGLSHSRFLRSHRDHRAVVEGLKAMLARAGADPSGLDVLAMKRAVLRAQWRKLIELGAVRSLGPPEACDGLAEYASAVLRGGSRRIGAITDPDLTGKDLDKVARALGRKLRAALAKAAERSAASVGTAA